MDPLTAFLAGALMVSLAGAVVKRMSLRIVLAPRRRRGRPEDARMLPPRASAWTALPPSSRYGRHQTARRVQRLRR